MARALVPALSAADAEKWLHTNPSIARTLRVFASNSNDPVEVAKNAARAMRHELISSGSLPAQLAVGNDVRAVSESYARDLGFKNVEIASGVAVVVTESGKRSKLTELDPSKNASKQIEIIGKALNVERFGVAAVEPPPAVMQPNAKAYSEVNAHRMAHLSVLAYKDEATVKAQLGAWGYDLKTFTWLEDKASDTQGFSVADKAGNVFCIFRGTESLTDARVDADIATVSPSWKKTSPSDLKLHRGFANALDSVWPQVEKGLELARGAKPTSPVFFGGHSLGAAVGQVAALRAVETGLAPQATTQVYTLGSPRVGNEAFREAYNSALPRSFRNANFSDGALASVQDMVTQVAPLALGFRALGQLVRLKETGETEIIAVTDARSKSVPPQGTVGTESDPGTAKVEALRGEALKNYITEVSLGQRSMPEPDSRGVVAKDFALPSLPFHMSGNYLARTGLSVRRNEK